MTTRIEQKEQRRQEILVNALNLFVTKGYADTKIADIAKASGMSMGLMFHYFDSKEQLYRELVMIGAEGTNTPQKLNFSSPVDYFRGFLTELFRYAKEQPWVFRMFVLMMQARNNRSLPEDIRELALKVNQVELSAKIIEEGQKQGIFRKGNPYTLSFTFWSSVHGIMEQLATMQNNAGESSDNQKQNEKQREEKKEDAVTETLPLPDIDWLIDILTGGQNG